MGDRVVTERGVPDYLRWTIDALHRLDGDHFQAKIIRPRGDRSGVETRYIMMDAYLRRRGTRVWFEKIK